MSSIALKIKASTIIPATAAPNQQKTFGCFGCFTIFRADGAVTSASNGGSTCCPKCGQDTVLDSTIVPSLDHRLLDEVHGYWFAKK